MQFKHILITGGAGFVGSSLAVQLKRACAGVCVTAFDNLLRRGSELNLDRLRRHGVEFVHGDIRCPEDLMQVSEFDLLIECSAQPSVHAGCDGNPASVININLVGTVNCLEIARRYSAAILFLSSSRVYPIAALNALAYTEEETRFSLCDEQAQVGSSGAGISDNFTLAGARSFYGATKLASELLLQEYVFNYDLRGLIYRCGVIAGPWQMGRVDQGFLSLWVARHHFQKQLSYIGFGGTGKQVRDLLHIDDLFALMVLHLGDLSLWDGRVYNVGGGHQVSTSLLELTELCQQLTGRKIPITSEPSTSPLDVRIYVSDCAVLSRETSWAPRRSLQDIVATTASWIRDHEALLEGILA